MRKLTCVIMLGFALLSVVVLGSCSKEEGNMIPNNSSLPSSNSNSEGVQNQDTTNNINNEENIPINRMRMLNNQIIPNGYGTKDGYYYIANMGKSINILYVDYKSKQQVYLCDKSECKHDSDKCTSYFEPYFMSKQNTLYSDGNFLYLISSEYSNDGATMTNLSQSNGDSLYTPESEPAYIYIMNLDGSNRRVLASMDSGEYFTGPFYTDGEYLYGVSLTNRSFALDDATTYTAGDNYQLIGISLKTGNRKKVMDWNQDWMICGCIEDALIVRQLQFQTPISDEERSDSKLLRNALNNAEDVFVKLDTSNQTFEELVRFESKKHFNYIYDNNILYYAKEKGKSIRSINLSTKEDTVLTETDCTIFYQIYDGHMVITDREDQNKEFFIINLTNRVVEKFQLLRENGYPMRIIAETEEFYFVESNCELEEEYIDWAGVYQTNEINREYALISKEDYNHNKRSISNVSMIMAEIY